MAGTGNALPTRTLSGKPITRPQGQLAASLKELGRPLASKALDSVFNYLIQNTGLLGLSWLLWRWQESFL